MGSAVQSSPLTSTLTMRAFLTVLLASLTLLSTIPSTTERGRLRLSLSLTPSDRSRLARLTEVPSLMLTTDTVCPRLLGSPTLLCIPSPPWSTARGRLRPSPSTVTPLELSLTCTTLLLWLPLVSAGIRDWIRTCHSLLQRRCLHQRRRCPGSLLGGEGAGECLMTRTSVTNKRTP